MRKVKSKKIRKISVIMLIFSVLMLLFVVLTYADENIQTHTSCVEEHFTWVQNEAEYPENEIGNCPFVAFSLLLSFYDAYWDDRFVPDSYEMRGEIDPFSGEITSEFYFDIENDEWERIKIREGLTEFYNYPEKIEDAQEEYSNLIRNYGGEYFQLYLISLAKQWGYYGEDEYVYGMIESEMISFLERYLSEICGFPTGAVTVHCMGENLISTTNEDVFNKTKEILSGNITSSSGAPIMRGKAPVIVNGLRIGSEDEEMNKTFWQDTGSHTFLAYGLTVNEDGEDDITVSYCYNGEETKTFRTMSFKYLSSIIWLEINPVVLSHKCSTSYFSPLTGDEYCVCQIYSDHPNHACNLPGNQQDPCPNSQSYVNCLCGQQINGYHTYSSTYEYSPDFHYSYCSCGYEYREPHTFEEVHDQQEGSHYYRCDCGYEGERHNFVSYRQYLSLDPNDSMRNSYHIATCECGDEELLPHSFIITITQSVCRDCGFTRPHIGPVGNIIMGKKEDEETE